MRYAKNLKRVKIVIKKGNRKEILNSLLIKTPKKVLNEDERKNLKKDVTKLVENSWGKFNSDYIENSVINSYFLCLIFNDKSSLIALAPLKKIKVENSYVYSFGLTAVDPAYRKKGLLRKMGFMIARKVLWENVLKLKFKIEIIFITPNIRTLSTVLKYSDFVYPNPYEMDEKGVIPEADDITWKRVNAFLKLSKENVTLLDRRGMVMEGFYENNPQLVFKEQLIYGDEKIDRFGEKYLYNKPGRELVVRAILSIKGILSGIRSN